MCNREPQRLRDAADQLNRYAFRHATPILIAPPGAAPDDIRSASGFLLRLGHHTYLGTAWHVVQYWIGRLAQDSHVLFQVGGASFAPDSIAWRDEANDLVLLHVSDDERDRIDASVCEPLPAWPPAHLAAGNDLFVCGFPRQLRQHLGPQDLNFIGPPESGRGRYHEQRWAGWQYPEVIEVT